MRNRLVPTNQQRASIVVALPALLILVYLALRGGGFDLVVFGELAVVAWWLTGVGLLFGLLPARRLGLMGWALLTALAGLTIWTLVGLVWSDSAERTVSEAVRLLTLLGVAALLLLLPGRRPQPLLAAVGAAAAIVAFIGLLSRFQPALFAADNEVLQFLPTTASRLAFPLDYWNALALLIAMAIPALLALSASARSRAGATIAAAVVPAMALAAYLTLSRSGLGALAIAVVVLVALHPRRLSLATALLPALAGTAILIWAAERREALSEGLETDLAHSQGDSMMFLTLGVIVAVAAVRYAIFVLGERRLLPRIRIARRETAAIGAGLAIGLVVTALAAGVPDEASDRWAEFKNPSFAGEGSSRLASSSGRGRYQWWEAAVDAGREEPLHGIGPGTYVYYWNQHGTLDTTIVDAHSLYLEAFAELGIPGLLLILILVGGVVVGGTAVTLAAPTRERALLAGAVSGCVAFAVGAAVDWSWETTILPVGFVILAATVARAATGDGRSAPAGKKLPRIARVALAAGSLLVAVAIMLPTAGADQLEVSQERFDDGDMQGALEAAETAEDLAPWASGPLLQQALVLEQDGAFKGAARETREAIERDRLNWQPWLILSRIEAKRERHGLALDAFERAESLNPRARLFADSG